jgi:uncharacterized protein YqjF (DUF2071 family)
VGSGGFPDSILDAAGHRPWPVPDTPWIMRQTWHDLLFAHWPIDPARLRAAVPAGVEVDLYEGRAWVGIVPFHMSNVTARGVPPLPWISAFPELNVRTYVRAAGKPGVFFFSLDAANPLAVKAARTLFNLPYFAADMEVVSSGSYVIYRSHRRSSQAALFQAEYGPTGLAGPPQAGSLEEFLTERYCLYAPNRAGALRRLEIHHPPWALQPAEARISVNTMAAAAGLSLPDIPPLLHFAKRQDMVGWPIRLVKRPTGL